MFKPLRTESYDVSKLLRENRLDEAAQHMVVIYSFAILTGDVANSVFEHLPAYGA